MFGKRAKNQSQDQDQDFEGAEAEFTEDFASQDQPEEAAWGDDQSDAEDGLEPELRDRRRSPLSKVLPFAALGVIAAGGAGYYYLNFMQAPAGEASPVIAAAPAEPEVTATAPLGEAQPADETVVAATPLDTPTEATTETAVPLVAGAPEIVPSDTAMLEPAEPVAAAPEAVAPAPTDIQPELTAETAIEAAPVEAVPETVAAIETPVPAETAPVEAAPAEVAAAEPVLETAPVVTPEPAITAPVAAAPAVVAPVETPVAATSTSPAVTAAAENLADISGRMDVLERQIEDLTKAVDNLATQGAGTTSTAVDAELKSTVTALQDQVRKLQSELSSVRTASPTPAATASSDPAPARPVATRSTPAPRSTATETPRSRPAAAAPAPVRWVLRAAQSNEAWVSRSAEGQLRSVSVGESLEGIGRITAIRQNGNGGWEVIGTQGSLRQ